MHVSVDGLGCFHTLTVINNADKNIHIQIFVWTYVSSSPGEELLDHVVILLLSFEELTNCFPCEIFAISTV